MYGYAYSYNKNGLARYRPYISYSWSVVGNELVNKGTSTNAQMFTGRALSFDSASSQSVELDIVPFAPNNGIALFCNLKNVNISSTVKYLCTWSTSMPHLVVYNSGLAVYDTETAYYKKVYDLTEGEELSVCVSFLDGFSNTYVNGNLVGTTSISLHDGIYDGLLKICTNSLKTIHSSADISNLIVLNEALTPEQIADYHATPHTFLYKTDLGLASDSGLDTSKVVAWFPLTEDDGSVTDIVSGTSYVITNATVGMYLKGLNYGLQTAKLLLDDNGVVVGKSDYLECHGNEYVDTQWIPPTDNDWSVEFVYVVNPIGKYQQNGCGDSVSEKLHFGTWNNNSLYIQGRNPNAYFSSVYTETTAVYGVIIFDGTNTKAFVNGVEVASWIDSLENSGDSFCLGGRNVNGILEFKDKSETRLFKVHNKVLTQEEITANYNDYVAKGLLND